MTSTAQKSGEEPTSFSTSASCTRPSSSLKPESSAWRTSTRRWVEGLKQRVTPEEWNKHPFCLYFLCLAGAQPFLPALWLRASLLCGQTYRHGDDEGRLDGPVVSLHSVSPPGLHAGQHQADQQPVAAACGGRARPRHALHPTYPETKPSLRRNTRRIWSFWMTTPDYPRGCVKGTVHILWRVLWKGHDQLPPCLCR